MDGLFKAMSFMTILQMGARSRELRREDMRSVLSWMSSTGAAVAVAGYAAAAVASWVTRGRSGAFAAVAAVAGMAAVTGFLHLDGLADSFDGLFAPGDRPRRLAIMREPRLGAFGVAALALALMAKAALVWAFLQPVAPVGGASSAPWFLAPLALAAAACAGRWTMLVAAAVGPYARPDSGTARIFIDEASAAPLALGGIAPVALLAAALAMTGALHVLLVVPMAVLFATAGVLWGLVCRRQIGGQTGDTLGAAVEMGEILALALLVRAAL